MSLRREDAVTTIYYPESDGKPMAETDLHAQLIIDLRFALKEFFRDDPDLYVSGNLLLYYVEGDPRKSVAPDVFVVRGAGKRPRRVYKLWEEKLPPNVVFEISSSETWKEDLQRKWQLYAQIGVKEYFIFDPEYTYLKEPLLAYRLKKGQLAQLKVVGGRVHSAELGLDVIDTGETLRLFDPKAERFLPTEAEVLEARRAEAETRQQAEEALRRAEKAHTEEAEARRRAEDEVARLRRELEMLRQQISSERKSR